MPLQNPTKIDRSKQQGCKNDIPEWAEINEGLKRVRLLEIFPGEGKEKIQCRSHLVGLEDPGLAYQTLSYVWGTKTAGETIRIDDYERTIGANLHDALVQLRSSTESLCIWVDALCINQADEREKTQQVNLMREIYATCYLCNIWLGDFTKADPPLTMTQVQAAFDFIALLCDNTNGAVGRVPSSLSTPKKRKDACAALVVMMYEDWWERLWTVQEAILPSRARIVWGPLSLPWQKLEDASRILLQDSIPHLSSELLNSFEEACNPLTMRTGSLRIVREDQEPPLDILWRFRHRQATNPLDKVYGLMGLMDSEEFPTVFSCDYSLDTSTLYKRMTLDLVHLYDGLRPLIGRRGEVGGTPGLPTWAIDWMEDTQHPEKRYGRYWPHSWVYGSFRADDEKPRQMSVSEDATVLSLGGVYVDRISVVGDPILEVDHRREPVTEEDLDENIQRWNSLTAGFMSKKRKTPNLLRQSWKKRFHGLMHGKFPGTDVSNETESGWKYDMCKSQAFLITDKGYMGLGPATLRAGDEVWVLFGGRVPFILRPKNLKEPRKDDFDDFEFIGDAFVYEIMDGSFVSRGIANRTVRIH